MLSDSRQRFVHQQISQTLIRHARTVISHVDRYKPLLKYLDIRECCQTAINRMDEAPILVADRLAVDLGNCLRIQDVAIGGKDAAAGDDLLGGSEPRELSCLRQPAFTPSLKRSPNPSNLG